MNDMKNENRAGRLVQDHDLDAPPEKVWRAITTPDLRERWLPREALSDPAPLSSIPGEEVRYGMRDGAPPHLESVVTFQISARPDGGTRLRIIHAVTGARLRPQPRAAANSNRACLMRAA